MRPTLLLPTVLGALLLLALPGAQAAGSDALAVQAGVPVRLAGDVVVEAGEGAFLLKQAPAAWRLDLSDATLTTYQVTNRYTLAAGDPVRVDQKITQTSTPLTGASLRLQSPGPSFYSLAEGARPRLASDVAAPEAAEAWTGANAQISALLQPRDVAPPTFSAVDPLAALGTAPGLVSFPAGAYESRTSQGTATVTLERLIVFDATLESAAQRWTSARSEDESEGSLWVPDASGGGVWTGPGKHLEETTTFLVVTTAGAPWSAKVQGTDAVLYSTDLLADVDGFLQFPWAEGKIQHDGQDTPVSSKQLLLGGVVSLRALESDPAGGPTVTWVGNGNLNLVQVGPLPAPISPAGAALLATGAGATAIGVALAIYYWPVLKFVVSAPFIGLYARLPRDRILDHKGRELVYETVRNEPGISTHRLADVVGFGWSTLAYHLRVLERNQVIVSVRDGRYKRFFDRESGKYANGRKRVVAVLKNETTLTIGRHILQSPGITQKDLGERAGLSPSSVHWHVTRLTDAGLLEKVRDGHNVRYHPGGAWGQVPAEDVGLAPDLLAAFKPLPASAPAAPGAPPMPAAMATPLPPPLPQRP